MTAPPHIAFRVDASIRIGVGHAMRCLALADELRSRGARSRFLSRPLPPELAAKIRSSGHELLLLPEVAGPYLDSDEDVEAVLAALSDAPPWDWLVVDHYGLEARWEKGARRAALKILAIDDLADRAHDCDCLLDQNLKPRLDERYGALVPAGSSLLLGPRFALLRPEFARARTSLPEWRGVPRRVLVTFGGSDPSNETDKVLAAASRLGIPGLEWTVVLGAANPWVEGLRDWEGPGVRLCFDVADMASLMARSDLAVCAGGSTTWERFCLGLPALVIATADNQLEVSRHLGDLGLQLYLGSTDAVVSESVAREIERAIEHPQDLCEIRRRSMAVVDGQGARRVARVLLGDDRDSLSPDRGRGVEVETK